MKHSPDLTPSRTLLWLVIAGLALVGIVGFSVAAAVKPDVRTYEIGQIVAAVLLLVSVLTHRANRRNGGGQ